MGTYIYQHRNWPDFYWEPRSIGLRLAALRHRQGKLLGKMEGMVSALQEEAALRLFTFDVLAAAEMEGIAWNAEGVRACVVGSLGMQGTKTAGKEGSGEAAIIGDGACKGIVDMRVDATRYFQAAISNERLFSWHVRLFPGEPHDRESGSLGLGRYRRNARTAPMQIVSGPPGQEIVHFQAPDSDMLKQEMDRFIAWFNETENLDPVIKAALAHLWFETIHPFDQGNDQISLALTDLLLCRADQTAHRFYSLSSRLAAERDEYYTILEKTQKGSLDITDWLAWFLGCLDRAISHSEESLAVLLQQSRFWDKHQATPFNERQRAMLGRLLNGFEGKLTSSKWASLTQSSQDTAGRDINELVQRGILIKESAGGRSTGYVLVN